MSSGADAEADATAAIRIPVELSRDDVVVAHFWALSRSPLLRLVAVLNLLLLLASLLLALRALARGELPPLVLALAAPPLLAFFFLFPLAVWHRARASFEALGPSERRGDYAFTEEGFEWTLGRAPGRASWASVTATLETASRLLLLTPGARAHVVPKAEASTEALTRVRERLDARARAPTSC